MGLFNVKILLLYFLNWLPPGHEMYFSCTSRLSIIILLLISYPFKLQLHTHFLSEAHTASNLPSTLQFSPKYDARGTRFSTLRWRHTVANRFLLGLTYLIYNLSATSSNINVFFLFFNFLNRTCRLPLLRLLIYAHVLQVLQMSAHWLHLPWI